MATFVGGLSHRSTVLAREKSRISFGATSSRQLANNSTAKDRLTCPGRLRSLYTFGLSACRDIANLSHSVSRSGELKIVANTVMSPEPHEKREPKNQRVRRMGRRGGARPRTHHSQPQKNDSIPRLLPSAPELPTGAITFHIEERMQCWRVPLETRDRVANSVGNVLVFVLSQLQPCQ